MTRTITLGVELLGACPDCPGEYHLVDGLLPEHPIAGWAVDRPPCGGARQRPVTTHPETWHPEGLYFLPALTREDTAR